jgi:hypothetical protein
MPIDLTTFAGQNWLITPTALAVGEQPPRNIHDQKFLLVLSGVVMANLKGAGADWLRETVSFLPDMAGPNNSGPLNWAIGRFSIPRPTNPNYKVVFSLEEWAPFASLSSIFDQNQAVNAGFAVDVWRPTHFATGTDAFTNQPVGNIFTGIDVDVAIRDVDAWIFRLGYNISLLGKIVFLVVPEILFESNFDPTSDGLPPSSVQQVGTANVFGPPRSVIVIDPPFPHTHKWVQISRPNGPDICGFQGLFTAVRGAGTYNFSASVFMPTGSGLGTISFENQAGGEFLHIDFMQDNRVRIDDTAGTEFGSFPRDTPFTVQVTLKIDPAGSSVHIALSGGGASGSRDYSVLPPFQPLSLQFGAVRVWQGFPWTGGFDVTGILVTRT